MNYFLKNAIITFISIILIKNSFGQYTQQDTLRGSLGSGRTFWDVLRYDIEVTPDYANKFITATNTITFKWLEQAPSKGYMQIDLQKPMVLDSAIYHNQKLSFNQDGNAWFLEWPKGDHLMEETIKLYYHGNPRVAVNPPWDGGWIWTKDAKGRPWMTVACQGLGASVWYPCKDHQSDEPDNGASLSITVPDSLVAVGNGRLKSKTDNKNGTTTWQWEVKSPINNYTIIPYIGKYVNWSEEFAGEKGELDCSYWVLDYDLEKSKEQFGRDVKLMLKCFEYWFGPYPFYEDSYKLVEAPHLGMEHQSAVAYGNKFKNGYLGMDLSATGWGKGWDYIIVHESGHEWFANNITTNDIADMWIHEGFTSYSEVLFVECQYGKKAADEYCQGLRRNIRNEETVIGNYGVNNEGSGDMYPKGANLLHMIRQVINDDAKFRSILRGLNKDYYHQEVNSKEVENYISKKSGLDLSKIFDQYLRNAAIPVLEYKIEGKNISYRWTNCIAGFNLPVKVSLGEKTEWLHPTEKWLALSVPANYDGKTFSVDKNFYIKTKEQ